MPLEEEIFCYPLPDGTERFADPVAIHADLDQALGGNAQGTLDAARSQDINAFLPALERLRHAVCAVFDLGPAFDPQTGLGVRRGIWVACLNRFLDFQEAVKKKAAASPTCSPPSAPPPCAVGPLLTPGGTDAG